MPKEKPKSLNGLDSLRLVYSTNPDAMTPEPEEPTATKEPNKQSLKVRLDRKQRKGKTVTLVEGFEGSDEALEDLTKTLKTKCGIGGSAKDGQIILQGECKDKVVNLLQQMGYSKARGI